MKIIVLICRILVGGLFIVSGLIKANDILGFVYKLQEYFEPAALNLDYLTPYTLPIAIFICIGEILLGVALLMGALPRLTTVLLLAMLLFFTWLTHHTASCDPLAMVTVNGQEMAAQCVLECGCFGNAIPLTPWESFWKDIVLLVLLIPVLIQSFRNKISLNTAAEDRIIYPGVLILLSLFGYLMLDWLFPVIFTAVALLAAHLIRKIVKGKLTEWAMAAIVLVISGAFQFYTLEYLPLKDWRAYAIGNNLREQMKTAEELGKKAPVFAVEYTFTNTKTGKDTTILSNDYLEIYNKPWFTANYEVKSWEGKEVKLSDGYVPPIKDFAVYNYDDEEMTQDLLAFTGYTFLHISNDLAKAKTTVQPRLNSLAEAAMKAGHRFVAITNADFNTADTYRHDHQVPYEFMVCDQTELKIIIRSNPGLVLLKDATVMAMWSARTIPTYEDVKKEFIR